MLIYSTVDDGEKVSKDNENTSRLQWILSTAQHVFVYTLNIPKIYFDYSVVTWGLKKLYFISL